MSSCCCAKVDNCCCGPVMDDCLAKKIACIWKESFCDAMILPQIGYPSCGDCVMTLTHTLGKCYPKLKINGLCSKSMLANNAFYTAEVSCGKWLNLYQGIIPNIAGQCGCKSTGEVYIESLVKLGISVENDNYHWKGSCPNMLAISSKAIGMDPVDFTNKQIAVLKNTLCYAQRLTSQSCCGN